MTSVWLDSYGVAMKEWQAAQNVYVDLGGVETSLTKRYLKNMEKLFNFSLRC